MSFNPCFWGFLVCISRLREREREKKYVHKSWRELFISTLRLNCRLRRLVSCNLHLLLISKSSGFESPRHLVFYDMKMRSKPVDLFTQACQSLTHLIYSNIFIVIRNYLKVAWGKIWTHKFPLRFERFVYIPKFQLSAVGSACQLIGPELMVCITGNVIF